MDTKQLYITLSLELHLYSARIMKEHSIFLEASFTPANANYAKKANYFKQEFEKILERAIKLNQNQVRSEVIRSEELVTPFTLKAEKQTQNFTGININQNLTAQELRMPGNEIMPYSEGLYAQVALLNKNAASLVAALIAFKENILDNVLTCNMFTGNYPLLIQHIIREAQSYLTHILNYEDNKFEFQTMSSVENFWNQIMMEHALFMRGLLDPSEDQLIKLADDFAQKYKMLLNSSNENIANLKQETKKSLDETLKFKDFKTAGVRGIENCEIKSIIVPLLADHVLREANHYIRLLRE